jgi:hypothetical protein
MQALSSKAFNGSSRPFSSSTLAPRVQRAAAVTVEARGERPNRSFAARAAAIPRL